MLCADVTDAAALEALLGEAHVAANAIGPVAHYGDSIWSSCITCTTHQVDLAADIFWLRDAIVRHDPEAQESPTQPNRPRKPLLYSQLQRLV